MCRHLVVFSLFLLQSCEQHNTSTFSGTFSSAFSDTFLYMSVLFQLFSLFSNCFWSLDLWASGAVVFTKERNSLPAAAGVVEGD